MLDRSLQNISLCFPNALCVLLLNKASEETQMSNRIEHQNWEEYSTERSLHFSLTASIGFVSIFLLRLNACLLLPGTLICLIRCYHPPNFACNLRSSTVFVIFVGCDRQFYISLPRRNFFSYCKHFFCNVPSVFFLCK